MKKYFSHNGEEPNGPFDVEDLKKKNINRETLIWYEGIDNWIVADKIEELNVLFNLK
jgi:hypothetical protein